MQRSGDSLDGLLGTSVLSEFMDDLSQPGSEAAAAAAANGAIAADEVVGLGAGRSVFAPAPAPQVPLPGQGPISRGQLLAPGFYAPAFYGAGPSGVGGALPELPARHLVNLSKSDSTISSQITQMLRGGGRRRGHLAQLGRRRAAATAPRQRPRRRRRPLRALALGGRVRGDGRRRRRRDRPRRARRDGPRRRPAQRLVRRAVDDVVGHVGGGARLWRRRRRQAAEGAVRVEPGAAPAVRGGGAQAGRPHRQAPVDLAAHELHRRERADAPEHQIPPAEVRLLVKKREDEASARPRDPPTPAPPPPRRAAPPPPPAALRAPARRPPPPRTADVRPPPNGPL